MRNEKTIITEHLELMDARQAYLRGAVKMRTLELVEVLDALLGRMDNNLKLADFPEMGRYGDHLDYLCAQLSEARNMYDALVRRIEGREENDQT